MIIRTCLGLALLAVLLPTPGLAFGGCGVGCHATFAGACVRDGWQEGLPVRNECPATSMPTRPCGAFYRWDRRSTMCVVR